MRYLLANNITSKNFWLWLFIPLLSFYGCGNPNNGNSSDSDTSISRQQSKAGDGDIRAQLMLSDSLHILYLQEDQFASLRSKRRGGSQIALVTLLTNESPAK